MVGELPVMIAAVVVAVIIMLVSAGPIGDFVDTHPTVKMLALSFLLLIGASLVAEGFGPDPCARCGGRSAEPGA